MKLIVLDFSDWKIKVVNNVSENIQVDEAEQLLYEEYRFKHSSIEFMIVPELEIEILD